MDYQVLVYVVRNTSAGSQILLAEMTLAKLGHGIVLNGYGGKMESCDATPRHAVLREFEAEAGGAYIRHEDLVPRAVIRFCSDDDPIGRVVMVYVACQCYGNPETTQEMANPDWYSLDGIPYDRMMPGDNLFLPRILDLMASTFYGIVELNSDRSAVKFIFTNVPAVEMGM